MNGMCDIPLVDVIEVIPLENFKLHVLFEDGTRGTFDVAPYLDKGVFRALRDISVFNAVRVANGTAVWPGEVDIAPERLYTDMIVDVE